MSNHKHTHGVIYTVFREPQQLARAIQSTNSLKAEMPTIHVTLYSDLACDLTCFDEVIQVERPEFIYVERILCLQGCPYEYNLYLDADTFVCADIRELFTLLQNFDFAAAHAPHRQAYPVLTVPDSFPEYNCGVMLFKKSTQIKDFFDSWLYIYQRDLARTIPNPMGLDPLKPEQRFRFHDQTAMREALYHSQLRIATLTPEYNCRFKRYSFLHGWVKILHGPSRTYQAIENRINETDHQRVVLFEGGRPYLYVRPQAPSKSARWRSRLSRYLLRIAYYLRK